MLLFEKIIHKQTSGYMKDKLANYKPAFRKSHETKSSFMMVVEKWKKVIDKGECVSAILMDFSKAFDIINEDLS